MQLMLHGSPGRYRGPHPPGGVMAPIPILKPTGPMTLADVDRQLRGLSQALRVPTSAESVYRERVLLDADRLLDVRLAITKATR